MFIFIIVYSFLKTNQPSPTEINSIESYSRLLKIFNNPSDDERWSANTHAIQKLKDNKELAFRGLPPEIYSVSVFRTLPHNLPLLEFVTHGVILGSLFMVLLIILMHSCFQSYMFPFFIGLAVYWVILGVEIGSIYTVLMCHVLKISYELKISQKILND